MNLIAERNLPLAVELARRAPQKKRTGVATPSSAPPREGIGTKDVEAGISRLQEVSHRLPTGRFRRVRIVTTEMICIIGAIG